MNNLEAGYRAAAIAGKDKQPPLTLYSSLIAGMNTVMRVRSFAHTSQERIDFIDGKLDEMLADFDYLPESHILH